LPSFSALFVWMICFLISLSWICQINFMSHVINRRVSRAVKDHSISVTRILNDEKLWNIWTRLVQGEGHFWNMLLKMKLQTREKKWIHCSVRKPPLLIAKNQTKHLSAALWQLEFHSEWCFVYVLEVLWCKAWSSDIYVKTS